MKAMVTSVAGRDISVVTLDGSQPETLICRVKGKFRLRGIRTTNPVAVGDIVTVDVAGDDVSYITAIEPRRNYIIRRASNLSKESHIIAANIDRALLIVTLTHPETSTTFIDRFLATAQAYDIPVTIVVNKVDLLTTDREKARLDSFSALYRSIGYDVIHASAKIGEGIHRLHALLDGAVTLLSGNSGVGKSTLINRLVPGINRKTAAISAIHDTGMHTTTYSSMHAVPDTSPGSYIIDTPGIKGFGTIDFDAREVSHYFPEIFALSANCRYGNCTHTHEPGCAVTAAVENGEIPPSRYASYLSILDDTSPDKYRKPF